MGFLDSLLEPKKEDLYEEEFEMFSSAYKQDEIAKFMKKAGVIDNAYLTERVLNAKEGEVYKVYKYKPLHIGDPMFTKEPKNEHDKNAIKIDVSKGLTMVTVGYIPQEHNVRFAKLMKDYKIYNTNLSIVGGPYKVIKDGVVVAQDDTNRYYVNLAIVFRR